MFKFPVVEPPGWAPSPSLVGTVVGLLVAGGVSVRRRRVSECGVVVGASVGSRLAGADVCPGVTLAAA